MHQLMLLARDLTDDRLLEGTLTLVARERQATAELVAHLAEIDARGLALGQGYGSLYAFCRGPLGFSEAEACHRIEAARTARRFPLVLEMLRTNELTMTTAARLGRHLTPENHERLLREAKGKTKEEVLAIIAALHPRPDVATTLTRVAAPPLAPAPAVAVAPALAAAPLLPRPITSSASLPPTPPPPKLEPLAPARYRYQLTIDAETRALLQEARDLCAHLDPRDDGSLLKEALRLLVAERKRRQFREAGRPRAARDRHPDSRAVPAAVAREVSARDGHQCAYVSPGGRRCSQRRYLQIHHVRPYEAGGEMTAANLQLRCGPHNRYEARLFFARPDHPVQTG